MIRNPNYLGLVDKVNWLIEAERSLQGRVGYIDSIISGGGGGSVALPNTEVAVGTGTGVGSYPNCTYDDTVIAFHVGNRVTNCLSVEGITFNAIIGDVGGNANSTIVDVQDTNKVVVQTNAQAYPTMQVETGGGDVTISDGVSGLYYDPPTLVAAATITMPANPVDGQVCDIWFGGTITSGGIVTTLTISSAIGQTIIAIPSNISAAKSGTHLVAQYRSTTSYWYIN